MIARDGVDGLTMRALATEAGTAVGLSYKAFASRDDLLWDLTWSSLQELAHRLDEWAARPEGALQDRLMEFYDIHRASPAPALVEYVARGPRAEDLFHRAAEAGIIRSWTGMLAEFLGTRQRLGTVPQDVDVEAFAFVISAALHHVLVTHAPFQVPDRPTLARYVGEVAARFST